MFYEKGLKVTDTGLKEFAKQRRKGWKSNLKMAEVT